MVLRLLLLEMLTSLRNWIEIVLIEPKVTLVLDRKLFSLNACNAQLLHLMFEFEGLLF